MGEIGQVVKIENEEVVVRLLRKEACAKCGACSAGFESKDMFIHANNMCQAKENDWVEIALEEADFIKAVLIMYVLPLIGLLIGVLVGSGIGILIATKYADLLGLLGALIGAGGTFYIIHINEHRFKTTRYKPRAIKIVDHYECD